MAAWIAKDSFEDKQKVLVKNETLVDALTKPLTKFVAGVRLAKPRG
jgi:hypothetical protein